MPKPLFTSEDSPALNEGVTIVAASPRKIVFQKQGEETETVSLGPQDGWVYEIFARIMKGGDRTVFELSEEFGVAEPIVAAALMQFHKRGWIRFTP